MSEPTEYKKIDLDDIILYALHYLHGTENVEDVVQECLTEFLESSEKGHLISDAKSYLGWYATGVGGLNK